jgi:predicted nucleic acid-binding protein
VGVVIDASAAMGWIFEDEASEITDQLFDYVRDNDGYVTSFWHLEIANAVLGAVKRNRIEINDAYERLELIGKLPIKVDADSSRLAWAETLRLARKYQLTTYDAAYFELAIRLGWFPLASFDKALLRAAALASLPVYSLE